MKGKILIALSVLLVNITATFSQSISDLDNRNGFKTLKLGVSMESFDAGSIIPVGWGGADSVIKCLYLPKGDELKTVFNTKFENIYLVFDGYKKLVGIQLKKKFSSTYHYQSAVEELKQIITNFRQLFGQNNSTISDNYSGKMGCIWIGKIVLLQVYTDRLGLDKGSENNVEVYDVHFADSKIKSGF